MQGRRQLLRSGGAQPLGSSSSLLRVTRAKFKPSFTLSFDKIYGSCRSFHQYYPAISAGVNNLTLDQHSMLLVVYSYQPLLRHQHTAKEHSENVVTLCSTAQLHIPHLPEIYQKLLSQGHHSVRDKMLVPLVSAIEGFHCIPMGDELNWLYKRGSGNYI